MKRIVVACIGVTLLLGVVFAPHFPWSARVHRGVRRLLVRGEVRVATWRGRQPRPVSMIGRLTGHGAQVEALKGAQVTAVESTSGYCALSDGEGRFTLPHLTWYPDASYNLIIAPDIYHLKGFKVGAPSNCPDDGIVDIGELRFDAGYEIAREETPVRYMGYDRDNDDFYRDLFVRLTAGLETEELKIAGIAKYVAGKLDYREPAKSFKSPRQVIERGSRYCSNLALAMAAITEAGGYPTRTVHLSNSPQHQNTHVVVEVYYADHWHLYDPTYGVFFLNKDGAAANYKELRLDPSLVTAQAFRGIESETAESILAWMPEIYRAGFHQIYQVNKRDVCYAW